MPDAAIAYRSAFRFAVPPEKVWEAIERTDQFDRWWGWLGQFRQSGVGLRSGSVLTGVVSPPVPYRMRVSIELEDCVRPRSIEAAVHGDLEGHASLTMLQTPGSASGTIVAVEWTVEMMQRPMRIAARFASPMLQWGHDRVVDATVAGFRRQIEGPSG